MAHTIHVTFSEKGEVVTVPENNTRTEVNSGDTVIWIFGVDVDVAEQKLEVRPKGSSNPFNVFPKPNQISGEIFINNPEENSFDYDIFRDDVRLNWADGSSGGCIKPVGGGSGSQGGGR